MGQVFTSEEYSIPYDFDGFHLAWLAFKSEAKNSPIMSVERDLFVSSKVLRKLFGQEIIELFSEPRITKEMLVWNLAELYIGSFEEKIAYIFDMYAIINDERPISANDGEDYLMSYLHQTDYNLLIQYGIDKKENIPVALKQCNFFPHGSDPVVSQAEFLGWLIRNKSSRKYLTSVLPPKLVSTSPDGIKHPVYPQSPSTQGAACQYIKRRSTTSSLNLVGGEDSSEEDDDDDDTSAAGTPTPRHRLSWARFNDEKTSGDEEKTRMAQTKASLKQEEDDESQAVWPSPSLNHNSITKANAKGLQKVSKRFSRVKLKKLGSSFRPLHPGGNQHEKYKSSRTPEAGILRRNNSSPITSPDILESPYTSQCSRYICGFLFKLSDGKWSKRTWHQRWFILDTKTGVLYYYKVDPKTIQPRRHDNSVGRVESPFDEAVQEDSYSPMDDDDSEGVLNHSSLRGYIDLNHRDTSLLFEKQYAQNAPTGYFFQVSTLSIGEIERKRGTQLKVCALTLEEFNRWTAALSASINRKHNSPTKSSIIPSPCLQNHRARGGVDEAEDKDKVRKVQLSDLCPTYTHTYEINIAIKGYWKCLGSIIFFALGLTSMLKDSILLMLEYPLPEGRFSHLIVWSVSLVLSSSLSVLFWYIHISGDYGSEPGGSDELEPHRQDGRKSAAQGIIADESKQSGDKQNNDIPVLPPKLFYMNTTMHSCKDLQNDHQCYASANGEDFSLRSSNYMRTHIKQLSEPALFEFLGMDLVQSPCKLDNVGKTLYRPPQFQNVKKIFILNGQIPAFPPSNPIWGESQNDGPGYHLICYWKIPDDVLEEIEKDEVTIRAPEKRLLKKLLNNDSEILDRFKLIATVRNLADCRLTGAAKRLLNTHNGTPVLTRPQHRLYIGDDYAELDVNVYTFSFFARKSIHLLLNQSSKFIIDIGFVLQGANEKELPERILGCMKCVKADFSNGKRVEDLLKEVNNQKNEENSTSLENSNDSNNIHNNPES